MRSRSTSWLAGCLTVALALAACAPKGSSEPAASDSGKQQPGNGKASEGQSPPASVSSEKGEAPTGDVTLKVWSWRTEDAAAYKEIFAVFTAANPTIKVEFEAFQNTEYNQILATGLAGSDGPDVPMVRSYGQLQANIEAGQLVALDGKITLPDGMADSVVASAKGHKDGKLYAVPLATQTMQMFYNKDIFAANNLKVPTTWDEFIAVNEALKGAGLAPMALGAKDDWVLPIFADIIGSARYGGSEFEKKVLAGKANFTDPDYVASLQLVKDMQQYLTNDVAGVSYTDSKMQFTSGQAAQYPGGSFEIAAFLQQAPDLKMGSYLVPPPPGSVSKKALSAGWADGNFAINAKSKKQAAALKLLTWMTTTEFGQLVADKINLFSAIPGVTYNNPVMAEAWQNYEAAKAPYLLLVNFRYGEPMGTAVLGQEVQKMFLGTADPAGAAQALQTGISQWFKPAGS